MRNPNKWLIQIIFYSIYVSIVVFKLKTTSVDQENILQNSEYYSRLTDNSF